MKKDGYFTCHSHGWRNSKNYPRALNQESQKSLTIVLNVCQKVNRHFNFKEIIKFVGSVVCGIDGSGVVYQV